jgi:hypothetical protein
MGRGDPVHFVRYSAPALVHAKIPKNPRAPFSSEFLSFMMLSYVHSRARTGRVLGLGTVLTLSFAGRAAAQDSTAGKAIPVFENHGFVQVYYRTHDPLTKDGFRLRKADFKFNGSLSPNLKWRITFDAAKALALNLASGEVGDTTVVTTVAIDQKSRMLQDAALTYLASRYMNFDVGQQIVPLGLEATTSASALETIERANFEAERSRAVGLGDVRDIGVSMNGAVPAGLEYHVGMFNEMGDDQGSTTDANDQKSVLARLSYHVPILPGLQLGGTGGYEPGPSTVHKTRAATEAQFRNSLVTIRAETMDAHDGLLKRFGWYGLGALRPTKQLQLVTRFDSWDRDLSGESALTNALEHQFTVGASYLIENGIAKISLNVVRQSYPNVATIPNGTFALIAFQGLW